MSLTKALSEYLSIDIHAMRPVGFLEKEADQIRATVENVNRGQGWIHNVSCPACASNQRKTYLERFGRKVLRS
jgi:hypothetical protein